MGRTILCFFIMVLNFSTVFGQKVKSSSDKKSYKIEEKITLEFEVKASVDSISNLQTQGFFIVSGPNKSTSYSIIDGKTEKNFNLKYVIKASQAGKLSISSPSFYILGEEYKAPTLTVTITGENLTEAEMKKLEFDRFRENSIKPTGTLRYVLSDSLGYIESYDVPTWKFIRSLTQDEILQLKKLNH